MSHAQDFKVWWQSLQPRERQVLAAGAVFLALFLLYAAVLHPFYSSKSRLTQHVQEQQDLIAWMRPASSQIQSLRGRQPSALPSGQSLLAVVSSSATGAGFGDALKQAQTNNDGSVRLQLQAASFDNLVRWLDQLHGQYGLSAREFTAQRGKSPGTVDATLTLQAPGA